MQVVGDRARLVQVVTNLFSNSAKFTPSGGEDKKRRRDAGFDHHLTKPVEPREIEQLLALVAARRTSKP
jgi:hypothetical protein